MARIQDGRRACRLGVIPTGAVTGLAPDRTLRVGASAGIVTRGVAADAILVVRLLGPGPAILLLPGVTRDGPDLGEGVETAANSLNVALAPMSAHRELDVLGPEVDAGLGEIPQDGRR